MTRVLGWVRSCRSGSIWSGRAASRNKTAPKEGKLLNAAGFEATLFPSGYIHRMGWKTAAASPTRKYRYSPTVLLSLLRPEQPEQPPPNHETHVHIDQTNNWSSRGSSLLDVCEDLESLEGEAYI